MSDLVFTKQSSATQPPSGTSSIYCLSSTGLFYTMDGDTGVQTSLVGPTGPQGPAGEGVPTGGTVGQVLTKNSSTNYDTSWQTPAGTVSSVALSAPSIFTVSGSPVTSSGTLTFVLNSQSANTVLAGPSSGAAAVPTFRSLVAGDIPALAYLALSGGTLSGALNMSGNAINDVASPVAGTDAVNKNYVDNKVSGLSWRPEVALLDNVATTLPTGTSATIDGVAVANGNRVLFTALTSGNNEVYVAGGVGTSLTWTLATDGQAGTGAPTTGDALLIVSGTAYGQSAWDYNGTAWVQFNGAGQIQAGNGLSKSGNTLSLNAPVTVPNGGTGATSLGAYGVLMGNGTSPVSALAAGGPNTFLVGQGSSSNPSWESQPTLGLAGWYTGALNLSGLTSGTVTIKPQDAAGTYNFNLPTTPGSAGQVLVSQGGGSSPMQWTTIESGSKNYITYNNFENNATTGWSLAHSAISGTTPTSVAAAGTAFSSTSGGTAPSANLSIQVVTVPNQLAGSYSLEMVSSAANTAGDLLITQAYSIDPEDTAKVLSFNFYYKTNPNTVGNFSGTSSNTFAVWIYDVTGAAWIQPAGVYNLTQSSGIGICSGSFQTPYNISQFQLAIVCINAPSAGVDLFIDDVTVGPQASGPTKVGNPQVTVLTSGSGTYTTPVGAAYLKVRMIGGGGGGGANGTSGSPTGGGAGGNTTFGTSLLTANGGTGGSVSNGAGGGAPGAGGTATIASPATGIAVAGASGSGGSNEVSLVMSGGTGGASPFGGTGGGGYGASAGYSAQANSGSGGGGAGSGSAWSSSGGGGAGGYIEAIITAPAASYSYAVGAGGAAGSVGGGNGYAGGAGGSGLIEVTAHFGTGGLVDAQGDGRVVAIKINSASTSVPSGASTQVIFTSIEKDSTSSYSTSTGNFTAPKSGFYNFESSVTFTAGTTSDISLFLYKNGALYGQMGQNGNGASGGVAGNISSVWMNAGDYVSIYVLQSSGAAMTVNSSSTYTWFSGHMVSGSVIPQAGQSVNANYHLSANVAVGAGAVIPFNVKDRDTNNAFSTSTYLYTIPVSGEYQASVIAQTTSGQTGIYLVQNGTATKYILPAAATGGASGSANFHANAGDTIGLYCDTAVTLVAAAGNSAAMTQFSLTRIGD